jgi:lipid-A-disaccharide synthase-like uncharacterized protein
MFAEILTHLFKNFFGYVGGALFFLSWIYQAYISKKANSSIVNNYFWLMRLIGMIFTAIHSIIIKDAPFSIMNVAGTLVYIYNLYQGRLQWRNGKIY